jgi:hypothetical protein
MDDVSGLWRKQGERIAQESHVKEQASRSDRQPKKVKPHGTRTRSADRTRKSKPYSGPKGAYRDGPLWADFSTGHKPDHAARAVQVDDVFNQAPVVQAKRGAEFAGFLGAFLNKKRLEQEELALAVETAKQEGLI